MVRKLINFTNKSFNNYTGPEDNFRSKNIIFGYNGCGKSSFIKGIQSEFLKEKDTSISNIRSYSADYLNKSLLLGPNNRRTIKGIRAVFGEKNIDIEEKIKRLEENLIDTVEIDKLRKQINSLDLEVRKEINKIFSSKKGTLRIQSKPTNLSISQIIQSYQDDLINALKVDSNKDSVEKTIGDNTIELNLSLLEELDLVPHLDKDRIDFSGLLEKQQHDYDDIEIPNSNIINWLKEGLPIHVEKDNCEFCGSPINLLEIKEKISNYVNNVKFEAEIFYNEKFLFISQKINMINQIITKKSKYIQLVDGLDSFFYEITDLTLKIIEDLELLKFNSENISNIKKIDYKKFESNIDLMNETSIKFNQFIKDAIVIEKNKSEKLSVLVKGAISIAIAKSTLITNNIFKITQNEKTVSQQSSTNEKILKEIKSLKESKIVTVDFLNLVNEVLRDLNVSIELRIYNNDYILNTTLLRQDELTVDDISEGEKNLLSLLFFYFEMFDDEKQTVLKDEIKLIILDDPISSMDDNNRFYVLEIVKNIMNLPVNQVFVLSHVWDDYCQLIYSKNCFASDSHYASYEIIKTNESAVRKNVSRGNPYKHMFKEIYEIAQKSELATDCEFFHIPNTIRKVFEEFLFFKTNGTLPQNSSKCQIESLFNITSNTGKTKLGTLLSISNVLSHKNTKTNEDILVAAKFLMKLIEENDKLHFNAMKQ